ncbi:hypothetical protein EsVE80_25800 [Enterococcus saigonensis]|uniref:Uncharacterized protein n=1 Tax=Enterococcus saigonensis TaxID=1805431 RepID=A0A679ITT0_9ENTE|nr:hypothetical protein [Enterococcus saigonensis]BCA87057.1 hypothetical protein EsVE80_25800 [Enterococcus saigonensis]
MKVLFIFEDGIFSTFFVYDLQDNGTLWRICPEIKLHNITLGELYVKNSITDFLKYFSVAFSQNVTKYFILTKKEGLAAVKEAGLGADGLLTITVEKDFTALKNGQKFLLGPQKLSLAEIDAYSSYQIDDDQSFDVFTRQEDLIRFMKWKTVTPSLSAITQNLGTVKEHTKSNLGLRDMLKLGTGYLAKGNARMKKITVPAAGTYSVTGNFPYQLDKVNWDKNSIQLHPDLRSD